MIHIEKNQKVYGHDEFIVLDSTADYNNDDLILCAHKDNPTAPYSKFEAQFVAYGGMVYKITDDNELLKEIQNIDPATLIDIPSVDQIQAIDPFNQVVSDTPTPTLAPTNTPNVVTPPTTATTTSATTSPDVAPYFAPAPPVVPVVSTTTPGINLTNASSTPIINPTLPTSSTASSTIITPINASTTTTPIILPESSSTPI